MYFPKSNNTFEVLGATIINPGMIVNKAMIAGMIMNGFPLVIPKMMVAINVNNMKSYF